MDIDYTGLPTYMVEGIKAYIEEGRPAGSFLMALLTNNLVNAVMKADETNLRYIRNWALFLHNEAPSECWGSAEKVLAWQSRALSGK
jgi:hypothetical protein